MTFDFAELEPRDRYKLLANMIVPRPIALVVTTSASGEHNAAPFSFFNVFSEDPPVVVLGIGARARTAGNPKDTTKNIEATGEFTINLVSEALLPGMSVCAIDFPEGVNELDEFGFEIVPSLKVRPPRIAQSPVQIECKRLVSLSLGGAGRTLVIGEVLALHATEGVVDPTNLHVDQSKMDLVGRMRGGGWYVRTHDVFRVPEPTIGQWSEREV